MPTLLNPMMMRQIIMDHYENPRNKRTVEDPRYKKIHMDSASCVDDIYVYVLYEDGVFKDVAFDGVACTISTASTSIMTELLQGCTIEEARYINEQFMNMIHENQYDEECLEEAVAFANTAKQASRINCATIGWRGFDNIIKEIEEDK